MTSIGVSVTVVVNENEVVGSGGIGVGLQGAGEENDDGVGNAVVSGESVEVGEEGGGSNSDSGRSDEERTQNDVSSGGRSSPARESGRRTTVRSDPSSWASACSVYARATVVASLGAICVARRINLEKRISELDELLGLACDLWWFIRIIGNARIGDATLASGSGSEVGSADGSEEVESGLVVGESGARIWSRLGGNRIERNRQWRRN